MTKITYAYPVEDARGRAGKTSNKIMSKSTGTNYMKNNVDPANPKSTDQQIIRDYLKQINELWAQLDIEDWKQWEEYAAEINKHVVPGGARKTAYNIFQSINLYSMILYQDPATPPTTDEKHMLISDITRFEYDTTNDFYKLYLTHSSIEHEPATITVKISQRLKFEAQSPKKNMYRYFSSLADKQDRSLSNADEFLAINYPQQELTEDDFYSIQVQEFSIHSEPSTPVVKTLQLKYITPVTKGRISGRVSDSYDGYPDGISISLFSGHGCSTLPGIATVETSGGGYYVFLNIDYGQYSVSCPLSCQENECQNADLNSNNCEVNWTACHLYGNITGTIKDKHVDPIEGITVDLYAGHGCSIGDPIASTQTDSNGEFRFLETEYGVYSVYCTLICSENNCQDVDLYAPDVEVDWTNCEI